MLGIFLDLETSGLDFFHHRVLEIAFKIIDLSSGEQLATYESIVLQSQEVWDWRDPTSLQINGFTWEKLQQGKTEAAIGQEIIEIFTRIGIQRGKAVFICQNPSFDRGFFAQLVNVYKQEELNWPYHWLDFASMYWALVVKTCRETNVELPREISLSKNAIAETMHLPVEPHPHLAKNGVDHLILCYRHVVGFGKE